MRRLGWAAIAVLATACYDFREAEKTYCLEHLDVCGTDSGPHVEDGFVFTAHLTAATMPPPASDPYAPAPSTAALTFIGVLDETSHPHRLAYSWIADHFTPASIQLRRFDAGADPLDLPMTAPVGVVQGLVDAWVPDFRDGFVQIVATGTGSVTGMTETIGAPAVAQGREAYVAALSPGPPAPPSAWVVLQVDSASSDAHLGLRSALLDPSLSMGSALVGQSDSNPNPVDLTSPDLTLSPAQVVALHRGRQYALLDGTPPLRGQFLRPGAALYVVKMTGGQKVPPSGGAPFPGVVIWSPDNASELRVDVDALALQVGIGSAIAGSDSAASETIPNGTAKLVSASLLALLRERLAFLDVADARGQILRPGEALHFARLTLPGGGVTAYGNVQLVVAADGSMFISGAFTSAATAPEFHVQYTGGDLRGDVSGDSSGYAVRWSGIPPAALVTAVQSGTAQAVVLDGPSTVLSGAFLAP